MPCGSWNSLETKSSGGKSWTSKDWWCDLMFLYSNCGSAVAPDIYLCEMALDADDLCANSCSFPLLTIKEAKGK